MGRLSRTFFLDSLKGIRVRRVGTGQMPARRQFLCDFTSLNTERDSPELERHLAEDFPRYDDRLRILVYCFRGGNRSKLWADALETIGYKVDKLPGG